MRRPSGALAVLLACLVVLAVVAIVPGATVENQSSSSRNAAERGTLALYRWLTRLGLPVSRITGDFAPSGADVLVVDDPAETVTPEDAAKAVQAVRAGGILLFAADRLSLGWSLRLFEALGVVPQQTPGANGIQAAWRPGAVAAADSDTVDAHPAMPIDPGGAVHRVVMQQGLSFETSAQVAPVLTVGDSVVGVGVSIGAGRAFVLGSPYPLSNLGLREGDDALFLLSLIDRARGGHVLVDEVHHGEGGRRGATAALSGPVGLAAGLAALVIAAYLVASGRRLGRPIPAVDPARVPSATEYVGAMGALFERTRLRGGVADRYAQELKQRVGEACGIDPRLDDAAFLSMLAGYDPQRAEPVGAVLARARDLAAGRPTATQLVELARRVDELESGFAVGTGMGLRESR